MESASTKSKIDISVVIPTNRTDEWLNKAVKSVIDSEGTTPQIVMVFDGVLPPDTDWMNHPKVKVVVRPVSGGPGVAMQDGIEAADGTYVARLDSDDISLPHRFIREKEFLDANPGHGAVSGQIQRIDEKGKITREISLPAGKDIRKNLLFYNVVPHSTLMFRKSIGEKIGGYNRALRQMEDYEFLLRLGAECPIAQLSETLVQYRVHSEQTSKGAKARGPHTVAVLKARKNLSKKLQQSGIRRFIFDLIWQIVQYTRVAGITRPKHLKKNNV